MLQAKGFDASPDTSYRPSPPSSEANRFPYGWRYVLKRLPTGEELYDQIPLTANDLLNPQEGDQVPQSNEHFQTILDLASSLKTHYAKDPSMGVFGDLIMNWGIPGLPGPAPDIAIVPNLKDKDAARGTFKVVQEGTRPCLVIEVMSPHYHGDDTAKVSIYERAGITEYLLIKPRFEGRVPYYSLQGYRLINGVYHEIPTDPQGRWVSQALQLQFEVIDQGRQVRVTDLRTGHRLLTPMEAEAAWLAAKEAQLAAEARAEAEAKARAELEKRLQELENLLKSRT